VTSDVGNWRVIDCETDIQVGVASTVQERGDGVCAERILFHLPSLTPAPATCPLCGSSLDPKTLHPLRHGPRMFRLQRDGDSFDQLFLASWLTETPKDEALLIEWVAFMKEPS
jgi:hypothetical protein